MPKQTIGEFLATQRKAKGYTQQQVADMIGVSNRTLSSWEQGRSYPDIMTLPALAEIFGVTVDEILAGERATSENSPNELTEKSQKKLYKNALAKYSVKCTCLSAIGIGGPILVLLSFLLMFIAPVWLTIILWILAAIDLMVVAVLFAVFEKSALILDEEETRYTLAVKCDTYRGALFIGLSWLCILIIFMVIFSRDRGTLGALIVFILLIPSALFIGILIRLKNRSTELYTESERANLKSNNKLLVRICLIGFAIIVAFAVIGTVFENVSFPKKKIIVTYQKDEFINKMQSVRLNADEAEAYGVQVDENGMYFIDISVCPNQTVTLNVIDKDSYGYAYKMDLYHLDGNLYVPNNTFDYYYGGDGVSVYYLRYDEKSDAYRLTGAFKGNPMYLNGYESFAGKYNDITRDEYKNAIKNGEVVFCYNDDQSYFAYNFLYYYSDTIFGILVQNRSEQYLIEQDGDNYSWTWVVHIAYSDIVNTIAVIGIVITIVACVWVYFATRKKIKISI